MKRKKFKPYPLEPIKPTDEWQKIDKLVHQAQTQFFGNGDVPSPIAERITENYKDQLAWSYTPAGHLVKTIMESLDSEENHNE